MNLATAAGPSVGFRSDHLNSRPQAAHCPAWYALHTRSRCEKSVQRLLAQRGFGAFLPLFCKRSPLSYRRVREAQLPLFPGYVFARFPASPEVLHAVRALDGVAAVVGMGCVPVSVPDAEIEAIEVLLAGGLDCRPCSSFAVGEKVRVTSGPLRGVRGVISRRKGRQMFVVNIELIHRSVHVELHPQDLEAVESLSSTPVGWA